MNEPSSPSQTGRGYLLGLRGFLVVQSFLWVFLQTIVPTAVKQPENVAGPTYEKILRGTLSVLFWNESLIYSSFILLSARTICLPYLQNPSKTIVASAVFRRGLRLWFPTAVALAVVKILSSTLGTAHLDQYKRETGNVPLDVPYDLPNALAYFNSIFTLFWTNKGFSHQAGNTAFPSQTLCVVNIVYSQSYTVYIAMVIVPYTRDAWRVKAYIGFILSAWWVQSWAWYSATGLLLADAVTNMRFGEKAKRGVPVWRGARCPVWVPCTALMAAGLTMQFLWVNWRPRYEDKELRAHAGLYRSGDLNTEVDAKEPQARDDDYLLLVGFYLLLESSEILQRIFGNPFFTYLGRRSLSKSLFTCSLLPTLSPSIDLVPSHILNLTPNSASKWRCVVFLFSFFHFIGNTINLKPSTLLSEKNPLLQFHATKFLPAKRNTHSID